MNNKFTNSKIDRIINYFLVFLLVALSGFPFFTASKIPLIVGFIVTFFIFFIKGKKFNSFYFITVGLLILLTIAQSITFNFFSFNSSAGLILRWTFPFLVVMIVGKKLPSYYINFIYLFAIISFIFFIPSILFPKFYSFLLNNISPIFDQSTPNDFRIYSPNIIFYTVRDYSHTGFYMSRNSGPFWEPGAYAGYTIIAIIFNTISNRSFLNKKNIVFLLAVLSTLSTAGYLALSIFIFFYHLIIKRNIKSWLFLPIIIPLFIYSFTDLDIINTKLTNSVDQLKYKDTNEKRSRVVSALVDLQDIIKDPIFGKGRSNITRFGEKEKSWWSHRNNGDTDFAVKYGLPFWFFYFYFVYFSFKKYSLSYDKKKSFALIAISSILIIGFSETYFQQSFFISLFYLHLVYINGKKKII